MKINEAVSVTSRNRNQIDTSETTILAGQSGASMSVKLVTLGDSLTHGFQHASIRRTHWSFPGMVARALQIPDPQFRQSSFQGIIAGSPEGIGGPLLDLEVLMRVVSEACGGHLNVRRPLKPLLALYKLMSLVEDYWERGPGSQPSNTGPLHHNLGSWGFDLLDSVTLSERVCKENTPKPKNNLFDQIPEFGMYRSARRVLNPSFENKFQDATMFDAARAIARAEGGIENLLITLGANNVLASCVRLRLVWSETSDLDKLAHERTCTIWRPEHFDKLYKRLAEKAKDVDAKRVFVATVPHVTVPPVTRGVTPNWKERGVPERDGNYYEYYTRFWTWDKYFDPNEDPCFTRDQAKLIDGVIDEYNATIRKVAEDNGFYVVKLHEVLDDLAYRRNDGRPKYELPPELVSALRENPKTRHRVRPDDTVLLDTRFFKIPQQHPKNDEPSEVWQEQFQGGLFGLDGVHPTTTGYGIIAHEVLKTMRNQAKMLEADPANLAWSDIVANDTLLCDPPAILASLERTLDTLFSKFHLEYLIDELAGIRSETDA